MDILVNVANQTIKLVTNLHSLVEGTQKFVRFVFDLSDEWDDLTVFAQFTQNGESYNQFLDNNNCVFLPAEIVAGECTMMLYGSGETVIGTTNYLTLTINESILVSDAHSTVITESLYNQLVDRVEEFDELKQDVLISGTNIKTINDQSILGSGNIEISGGSGDVSDVTVDGVSVVEDGVASIDLSGKVSTSSVGVANGIAPLDASSLVDEQYLPSYVDDVIEGYYYEGDFYSDAEHTTPIIGETGKIYIDLTESKSYRWSGSIFVEITSGGRTYTAGNGIDISSGDVISVDTDDIQEKLVSGTNVKTINNTSILGSGNISITSGLQNMVDGSATGSVRGIGATAESSSYTIGEYAFAQGYDTKASGDCSHSEGSYTNASGNYSHAEGDETQASGNYSHAEGTYSISSGTASHTEGTDTVASGVASHAEGSYTTASGYFSHTSGLVTTAQRKSQTVIGEYNTLDTGGSGISDRGDFAFIVGNGTSDNSRSNAATISWNGDINIASGAHYKVNGTNLSASDVGAQPTLVSGTNIKTVNSQSLLGSGDIDITDSVSLTQAEYDALPTSEKNNGDIYYITDGVDSSISGIIGTCSLDTTAQTVKPAINEINTIIGTRDLDTTAQTVGGAINELANNYIIYQGTDSNNWSYRKWADGTAECWLYENTAISSTMSQEGSVYWAQSKEYVFPNGLFVNTPVVTVTCGCGSSYLLWQSIRWVNNTSVAWYYVSDTNAAKPTVHNSISAIGRWK